MSVRRPGGRPGRLGAPKSGFCCISGGRQAKPFVSAKRRWEACWWDDLAAKANQAGQDGNDFQFWQVCRQLGFREGARNRHGCRRTVANVDQDREAWKIFLHGIQADQGAVSEAVRQYVPEASHVCQALADIPNKQEFDNALKSMKFGKRGGLDDVTVELIRFGGEDLREVVFQVIKEMWQEASDAAEGREAERWTPSSCTGVCSPMFKNKGDRTDKANYRNLVMLSVSAKLVARSGQSAKPMARGVDAGGAKRVQAWTRHRRCASVRPSFVGGCLCLGSI